MWVRKKLGSQNGQLTGEATDHFAALCDAQIKGSLCHAESNCGYPRLAR